VGQIEGVGLGGHGDGGNNNQVFGGKKQDADCQGDDTYLERGHCEASAPSNAATANWRDAMELFQRMPVDRAEMRRLAKDPDAIAVVRMIDLIFERMAKRMDTEYGLDSQVVIEGCWRLLKRGILRISDPEVDDDDEPVVQGAVTPGQRARARYVGARLYAIRQYIRRSAKENRRA
jgi:hypothetical protein